MELRSGSTLDVDLRERIFVIRQLPEPLEDERVGLDQVTIGCRGFPGFPAKFPTPCCAFCCNWIIEWR